MYPNEYRCTRLDTVVITISMIAVSRSMRMAQSVLRLPDSIQRRS